MLQNQDHVLADRFGVCRSACRWWR